jgi:hypothetical protein
MSSRTMLDTLMRVGVVAMITLGCATAPRETDPNQVSTTQQSSPVTLAADNSNVPLPRRTSDLLTAVEIAAQPSLTTALDAVERLRPWFLHPRSARNAGVPIHGVRPAVFLDGFFQGEIEILRTISVSSLLDVQYIRPLDAVHRFGAEYQVGIIFVRVKR